MSRTGASTPDTTNTDAAAASRACSLRRASARFRGDVRPVWPLRPDTVPVPPVAHLQNGTVLRMMSGATFRFIMAQRRTSRPPQHPPSRVRDSAGHAARGHQRAETEGPTAHVAHDRTPVRDHDGPVT